MPPKPKRPCNKAGCKNLTTKRFCEEHEKQERKRYDTERGSAASRGYDRNWQKIRLQVLNEEPLCRRCTECGDVRAAVLIHHVDRDSSNNSRENLEPLCNACHEREHSADRFG